MIRKLINLTEENIKFLKRHENPLNTQLRFDLECYQKLIIAAKSRFNESIGRVILEIFTEDRSDQNDI